MEWESREREREIIAFYIQFMFITSSAFRITAKIDDDMLSYYCNEDIFLLEVRQVEEDLFDITLTELSDQLIMGK